MHHPRSGAAARSYVFLHLSGFLRLRLEGLAALVVHTIDGRLRCSVTDLDSNPTRTSSLHPAGPLGASETAFLLKIQKKASAPLNRNKLSSRAVFKEVADLFKTFHRSVSNYLILKLRSGFQI